MFKCISYTIHASLRLLIPSVCDSQELIREAGAEGKITYSIVQPTAFFKSLAGQVESVVKDGPYVMFGDGELTACKPIGEVDLANFIIECLNDPAKENQTLPIGKYPYDLLHLLRI